MRKRLDGWYRGTAVLCLLASNFLLAPSKPLRQPLTAFGHGLLSAHRVPHTVAAAVLSDPFAVVLGAWRRIQVYYATVETTEVQYPQDQPTGRKTSTVVRSMYIGHRQADGTFTYQVRYLTSFGRVAYLVEALLQHGRLCRITPHQSPRCQLWRVLTADDTAQHRSSWYGPYGLPGTGIPVIQKILVHGRGGTTPDDPLVALMSLRTIGMVRIAFSARVACERVMCAQYQLSISFVGGAQTDVIHLTQNSMLPVSLLTRTTLHASDGHVSLLLTTNTTYTVARPKE